MLILVLLGMYFDAVVVFVTKSSLLLRLAVAILCDCSKDEHFSCLPIPCLTGLRTSYLPKLILRLHFSLLPFSGYQQCILDHPGVESNNGHCLPLWYKPEYCSEKNQTSSTKFLDLDYYRIIFEIKMNTYFELTMISEFIARFKKSFNNATGPERDRYRYD